MREYGQIQCAFWQSDALAGATDAGRLLAAYLLTGPHSNGIGCYRLPDGYIVEDLRWSSGTVQKGFAELLSTGFAFRFEGVVFIRNFLRWNRIANSNVASARMSEFRSLPKGEAKCRCAGEILKYCKHLTAEHIEELTAFSVQSKTVAVTVSVTVCQPGSDPNRTEPDPNRSDKHYVAQERDPVLAIFEHWRSTWNHPKARLDAKRREAIQAALKLGYSAEDLRDSITGYLQSPHHRGENDRQTVYDSIDLLLRDAKHIDAGLAFARGPPPQTSDLTRHNVAVLSNWQPRDANDETGRPKQISGGDGEPRGSLREGALPAAG